MKVKKMTQHILAIILVVVMLVSSTPVTVFAVEPGDQSDPMALSASIENGMPGETVNVTVKISDNPGIASLKFYVDYDSALTLTAVDFKTSSNVMVTAPKPYTDPQPITMISPLSDYTGNGVFAVLSFKIKDDAVVGRATDIKITYGPKDVYNGADEPVDLAVTNGKVYVYDGRPGDVDCNGVVNTKDANTLFRHVSGWDVAVDSKAVDVNGDNEVTTKDAIDLFRYVAGWDNVILYRGAVKHGHVLAFVEAKNVTCTEDGYSKDFWYCDECNMYFEDAEGKKEIEYGDTIVSATGHTEVVDLAVAPSYTETGLTEGSHCGVCGEVIIAQETVPMLQATYHAIIYRNLQGAESPIITQFAEHEGIAFEDVPDPVRSGYKFLGWYTASEGGTKKDMIESGTQNNVTVYAHWEAKPYTITYKDAPSHTNKTQYTIEEEVTLSDPEWPGLIFAGWIDETGNPVNKIFKGSVGSVTLTATWREKKNYAVPTKGIRELWVHYDEKYSQQYFVYDLGTIYNVILETFRTKDKMVGESIDWSYTNEVSFEQGNSETASKAVTQSVSKTIEWSETNEWAKSHSDTFDRGFKVGGEWAPIKDVLSFNLSGEFNWSDTDEESWGTASTNGESNSESEEFSDSYSSAVTFNKTVTEIITTTTHIGVQMPAGTYRNVAYGSVRVFAVVTYDVTSGNYRVDTFSVLSDEVGEMTLYEPPVESNINIQANAGLPLDVPLDELKAYMDKAYYVQYRANSGSGSMMISAHISGEKHKLSDNLFTKEGYSWIGWKLADGTIVTNGSEVSDLAASGEMITATAQWSANPYTVTLDANGGTVGTETVMVTYDSTYGILPEPVRSGYTFNGWKFGDNIITSETKVSFAGVHTLVAQWTANTYTVTYNANGGSVDIQSETKMYDSLYNPWPTPTRTNCEFAGWYIGSTKVDISTKVTTADDHTLTARWKPNTSGYWTTGSRDQMVTTAGRTEYWQTGLNRDALKAAGYTEFTITIKMNGVFDSGDWFKADWWFEIYSPSGQMVVEENEEHWSTSWSSRQYSYTLSLDALYDDGTVRVWFDHGGDENDDFKLGTTEVWTTAK